MLCIHPGVRPQIDPVGRNEPPQRTEEGAERKTVPTVAAPGSQGLTEPKLCGHGLMGTQKMKSEPRRLWVGACLGGLVYPERLWVDGNPGRLWVDGNPGRLNTHKVVGCELT